MTTNKFVPAELPNRIRRSETPILAADIEIQANEILHHKLTLNGYMAEFTGKSMEQMTMDTDRDFFMGAQEAVEYGIVDAVISKPTLPLASTNGSMPRLK